VSDAALAGAFYRPTLLEVDDVESDIVQNEVFGPVPVTRSLTAAGTLQREVCARDERPCAVDLSRNLNGFIGGRSTQLRV
jgi:hypothetical protein